MFGQAVHKLGLDVQLGYAKKKKKTKTTRGQKKKALQNTGVGAGGVFMPGKGLVDGKGNLVELPKGAEKGAKGGPAAAPGPPPPTESMNV